MASPPNGRPHLPPAANLEYLKNQAKARLRALRVQAPETRLAAAQLAIARDLGFKSWRALKAAVEQLAGAGEHDRYAGYYRLDPDVITNSVIRVTEAEGHVFVEEGGRARAPLVSTGPDTFGVTGSKRQYRFEGPAGRPAERVVVGGEPGFLTARRTNAADAREAEAALARDLAEQARPRSRVTIAAELLDAYAGVFKSDVGTVIEVERRGGALFARVVGQPALEIFPEGQHIFFYTVLPVQISFQMRGKRAEALRIHQNGRVLTCRRTTPDAVADIVETLEQQRDEQERPRIAIPLGADVLRRYVGRYDLNETTKMTVTLEDGRLFGQITNQRRFEMFAEAEASFFLTIVACQISFIADEAGRIDRAVIHQNGRDILLMRENAPAA